MSYNLQGPLFPRTDTTPNTLPYILKTNLIGTTCDANSRELYATTPYVNTSTVSGGGFTADAFSKLFLNNNFSNAIGVLKSKNIISAFMPEFYIASQTEVKSTWTPFANGDAPFDGNPATNYEIMTIYYSSQGFTATVNGAAGYVTAITGITLSHSILQGNNGPIYGTGMYRKLGQVTQH
jgi:hypothetical protein